MPVLSKEFLDIQATIECIFTLKRVRDMISTHNTARHLVSLAKWLSVCLRNKWLLVRILLPLLKLQTLPPFPARSFLTFRQLLSVISIWNAQVTWQQHTVKNYWLCLLKCFLCSPWWYSIGNQISYCWV